MGKLIDSLECQSGDTFDDGQGLIYTCQDVFTDTILGYYTECKLIDLAMPDIQEAHTLAKDMGIYHQSKTFMDGSGGKKEFDLVYANVAGRTYGEQPNALSAKPIPPLAFRLNRIFPNPFNPTANISYTLGKSGRVRLVIYDPTGKIIATLVDRDQQAGTYIVQFDGRALASGVYLVGLLFKNRYLTKKMILLK